MFPAQDFLQKSFRGGTDLEAPLVASIRRLRREGWQSADILLITDSKVEQPSKQVLQALKDLHQNGLRIFGLVVAEDPFDAGAKCLAELCDEVLNTWSLHQSNRISVQCALSCLNASLYTSHSRLALCLSLRYPSRYTTSKHWEEWPLVSDRQSVKGVLKVT